MFTVSSNIGDKALCIAFLFVLVCVAVPCTVSVCRRVCV